MKILLRHTELVEIELEQVILRPGNGQRVLKTPDEVSVEQLQDYLNAGAPGGASPVAISLTNGKLTEEGWPQSKAFPIILQRRQTELGWIVQAIDDKATGR